MLQDQLVVLSEVDNDVVTVLTAVSKHLACAAKVLPREATAPLQISLAIKKQLAKHKAK
jgi:hypothetical protein